jgi:hypothetical protein
MSKVRSTSDERDAANGTPEIPEGSAPPEAPEGVEGLLRDIVDSEKKLWTCLGEEERAKHPVTTYHLEQIASHLHSLLFLLKAQREPLANDPIGQASLRSLLESLRSLLDRLDEAESKSWRNAAWGLSRNAAWELAGQFERQLIELGDDTYLYTLLRGCADRRVANRSNSRYAPV